MRRATVPAENLRLVVEQAVPVKHRSSKCGVMFGHRVALRTSHSRAALGQAGAIRHWFGAVAVLCLAPLILQCGSDQHHNDPTTYGDSGTGGQAVISENGGSSGRASDDGSTAADCELARKCCPGLTGTDRQACDGVVSIGQDLGCVALLAIHPECDAAKGAGGSAPADGSGGSPAGGASFANGGSLGTGGAKSNGGASGRGGASGSGGARTDGLRNYTCGYALAGVSGNVCENGRSSASVAAKDMTDAIAACLAAQPPDRPYFCCVLDLDGAAPTDASECEAAPALGDSRQAPEWRPGRSCCRFEGETTCPPSQ